MRFRSTVTVVTLLTLAACSETSGPLGVERDTQSTAPSAALAPAASCANPQPGYIWCDDFEQNRQSSYFEWSSPNASFSRLAGAGTNGSTGLRGHFTAGQVDAGGLKLAFGRTPDAYMKP